MDTLRLLLSYCKCRNARHGSNQGTMIIRYSEVNLSTQHAWQQSVWAACRSLLRQLHGLLLGQ